MTRRVRSILPVGLILVLGGAAFAVLLASALGLVAAPVAVVLTALVAYAIRRSSVEPGEAAVEAIVIGAATALLLAALIVWVASQIDFSDFD